jgi:hypothetical protein
MRKLQIILQTPPSQQAIIRPGVMIHTATHNLLQGLGDLSLDIQPRATEIMVSPRVMTQLTGRIDAYIEEVPISVPSTSHYCPTQGSKMLRDEWTRLRRKIDGEYPLYCSDLEEFDRETLIIGEKYVEDKSAVTEKRRVADGRDYGLKVAVTKAWDDYHTQLDKLFITGPMRQWPRLRAVQEQSKMELMLMLERHVRDMKAATCPC